MASMASSRRVVSSPFLVRVSRRTSGQRARYLWPIRGGYRRVAGKRHGSVAQLELEARCLFEDPNTTVHGPVVSGRALQREPEPLAHAVHAGRGFELVRSAIRPQYQSSRSAKYEVPVVVLPSVAAC